MYPEKSKNYNQEDGEKKMKTFIVNLMHNTERKEYMQEALKDIPIDYEFFPAVNGREIKNIEEVYDEKKALKIAKRGLSAGEIGCALSHRAIYKKMIDENIPQALILEDDITVLPDFFETYTSLSKINIGNKVILLGTTSEKRIKKLWKKKLTANTNMYLVLNNYAGTYGYVIGLKAAEKIYNCISKIFTTADDWKYYKRLLQLWLVSPSVVKAEEFFPSEIGDELRK